MAEAQMVKKICVYCMRVVLYGAPFDDHYIAGPIAANADYEGAEVRTCPDCKRGREKGNPNV